MDKHLEHTRDERNRSPDNKKSRSNNQEENELLLCAQLGWDETKLGIWCMYLLASITISSFGVRASSNGQALIGRIVSRN